MSHVYLERSHVYAVKFALFHTIRLVTLEYMEGGSPGVGGGNLS